MVNICIDMTWHKEIVIIATSSADTDLTCDPYLANMVSPSADTKYDLA